jgi:menaquinone-dependent protoporphyrinogen oxidase
MQSTHGMKRILIAYATRHGQTRRIAERIGSRLRSRGLEPVVRDLAKEPSAIAREQFAGAILAGSLHAGRHERELVRFAKANLRELDALPTTLVSVSGSEATVERRETSPAIRQEARERVREAIRVFEHATGWTPKEVVPVAGAILYTKYDFLTRLMLKWITKREGGPTDTSRDHEYTDWAALDGFADRFADALGASAAFTRAKESPPPAPAPLAH